MDRSFSGVHRAAEPAPPPVSALKLSQQRRAVSHHQTNPPKKAAPSSVIASPSSATHRSLVPARPVLPLRGAASPER
ncbi:hypothetical protein PR202_ga20964 [Eleusine coracana subsp. coracana]|uniref:Uncharacterized protein n=1 Tax=Eleusine coracana subsp. coracana TaxID=191504 RepID=A0AAV5CXY9_ELECO|nr:hypothetical protein PR202_ga20964 [Eleusine coracana subsp. coracana]